MQKRVKSWKNQNKMRPDVDRRKKKGMAKANHILINKEQQIDEEP